jgi:hypothetical protein
MLMMNCEQVVMTEISRLFIVEDRSMIEGWVITVLQEGEMGTVLIFKVKNYKHQIDPIRSNTPEQLLHLWCGLLTGLASWFIN